MKKKIDSRWCDREIHILRLYYCLVTTEDMYYEECKNLGMSRSDAGIWMGPNGHATTSWLETPSGKKAAIVSFSIDKTRTGIEIAGLLCHEAVHLWQRHCSLIGEDNPSHEFEAYGIQIILQELMEQYAKQVPA